jgi:phenol hydroxylase P4 protein
MPVRAITDDYRFPSRSRKELYGDDQLVHVLWRGNPLFCAAACFRAPTAMSWAGFLSAMVDPWASSDPAYVPGSGRDWVVDSRPVTPRPDQTLAEIGVGHKSLVEFRA